MTNEYEAKSIKVNKDEVRNKLKSLGAKLVFNETKFTRNTYTIIPSKKWIRLRSDGKNTTLTLKVLGENESDMKEIEFIVSDFDKVHEFLIATGFTSDGVQENLRERWEIDGVEIDIDTWPLIDPFVEVEAENMEKVEETFNKLGFDFSQAYFGSADIVYSKVYGIDILSKKELKF